VAVVGVVVAEVVKMSEEYKQVEKPLNSKLKPGDVFRFVLSNPRTMKEQNSLELSGSAMVSDYHADNDSYNILIWDYKGMSYQKNNCMPILDIKEAGKIGIMSDRGVADYRTFQLIGAHPDENFTAFKNLLLEDLGGAKDEPVIVLFTILNLAETNILKTLQDAGSPLVLNEESGKLEVIKKEE